MMRLLEEKGAVYIRGQTRGAKQSDAIVRRMHEQRANIKIEVNIFRSNLKMPAESALKHALMRRSHHLTRLLLDEGAIVTDMDSRGQSSLHLVASYGAEEKSIRRMIALGADVNAMDNLGRTPLHCIPISCYTLRDHIFTKILLEHGADTMAENWAGDNVIQSRLQRFGWQQLPLGETGVMGSRDSGYRAEIRLLLRNGSIDYRDRNEQSGLHMAAASNDIDLAEALLRRGIDAQDQDCNGKTALHWAARFGFAKMVRILIEAGADMAPQDNQGTTPLHLATRFNRPGTVRLMLWKGVDTSVSDDCHSTVLHSAAKWGDLVMLRLLLKAGANIYARNKEGQTPLLLAARYGHIAAVKLLFDSGSDISAQDNRGRHAPTWVLDEVCFHPERCLDMEIPNISLVNRLRREKDRGVWYTLCRDFFRDIENQERLKSIQPYEFCSRRSALDGRK